MPIYEYRCQKCKKVFEKIQRVGEGGEDLACPHCGKKKVEKLDFQFLFEGIDILIFVQSSRRLFEIYLRGMNHRWSTGDDSELPREIWVTYSTTVRCVCSASP